MKGGRWLRKERVGWERPLEKKTVFELVLTWSRLNIQLPHRESWNM